MKKYMLLLMIMLVILGQLGVDLYISSFPAMARDLQTSVGQIQLSLTFFLLSMAISQLFYGVLSDAIGRRPVILPAILLCAASAFLSWIAPNITVLLISRFLAGLGAGAAVVVARAVARDCYSGKDLALASSYLSIAWALVPMLAPFMGGLVQDHSGWRMNFLLLFMFALSCFLTIFLFLKETRSTQKSTMALSTMFSSFTQLLKSRVYLGYLLPPALFFSISIAYMSASSSIVQQRLGYSAGQYGAFIMVAASFYLFTNLSNRYFLKLTSMDTLIKIGIAIGICAAALLFFCTYFEPINVWVVIVPMILFYIAAGLCFANCVAKALTPFPQIAGAASALLGCLQIATGCFSSALMAQFHNNSLIPLAWYLVIAMALIYTSINFILPRPIVSVPNSKDLITD